MPLLVALLVLVAVLSPASAHAQSELRWSVVGVSEGRAVGDGTTVAWEELSGDIALHASGRPAVHVKRPASCPVIGRLGQTVAAVGADRLLLRCRPTQPAWRFDVFSLRFGTTLAHEFRVADYTGAGGHELHFDQIGRHWIAGAYSGYHNNNQLRFNWRTRESKVASQDEFGVLRWPDLSSAGLARPLCPPLRRVAWHDDLSEAHPRYRPLHVRGRWVLEGRDGSAQLQGKLRLLRCGSRRVRRLGPAFDAMLGRRWLVWAPQSAPGAVFARRLHDGRTLGGVAPGAGPAHGTNYAVTDEAVYASVPIWSHSVITGMNILRAPLPLD